MPTRVKTFRLFDKASRDLVNADGYKILIGDTKDRIEGIITNEFVVEANATWEPIFSVPDIFSKVDSLMNAGGLTVLKSGFFTRKFYKGGSYLEFPIEFRVVDWEGGKETDIVSITSKLLNLTAPVRPTKKHLIAAGKTVGKLGNDTTNKEYKDYVNEYEDTSEDISNLGGQEVQVTIGNYWAGKLIIESISARYSREMTERGPLYCDYSVKFSKREIVAKGEYEKQGFKQVGRRVTIDGEKK